MKSRVAFAAAAFMVAFGAHAQPQLNLGTVPTMTIVSGDNQKVARMTGPYGSVPANFGPLQVQVMDGRRRPIANAKVAFSTSCGPSPMTCFIETDARTVVEATTDANGMATLARVEGHSVRTFGADGPLTVVAKYGAMSATFHLTVMPPVLVGTLSIVSGDKQAVERSGTPGTPPLGGVATFGPMTVILKDTNGKPVPNVFVAFSCPPAGAKQPTCEIESLTSAGKTDGNGRLTLPSARAYNGIGKMPIVAAGVQTNSVTFDLTVLDPPPFPPPPPHDSLQNAWGTVATMSIVSGDNQRIAPTSPFDGYSYANFAPLTVQLKDGTRKPMANVRMVFAVACMPGGGNVACRIDGMVAQSTYVVTDAKGMATLAKQFGHSVEVINGTGPFTVRAYYGSAAVTFHLTVGN